MQGQAVGQYASQGPYDTTYDSKVKETVRLLMFL